MLGYGTMRRGSCQGTQYQLHSNRLTLKINAREKYEKMYMPFVHALVSNASPLVEQKAVEPFDANVGVDGVEVAHCGALDELRHHLQVRTHLYKFKDQFISQPIAPV